MTRNPVDSSVIASVGYDPDLEVLGVFFRDGKTAAITSVTAAEFAAFMAAPSKGSHYFRTFAGRSSRAGAGAPLTVDGVKAALSVALREPEPLGPLETFQHDDCCSNRLQKSNRTGISSWECPKCGTMWKKISHGNLMNWEPDTSFFRL